MSERARGPVTSPEDAARYEAIVVPRWTSLFTQMILRHVPTGARATVLDVGCGTGHPSYELLRRLGPASRVVAVDRDSGLVDLARRRAFDNIGRRIFFKIEPAEALSFGDEVFDFVVGNLLVQELEDPGRALQEMRRVLVHAGMLLLTRPLAGTFTEVLDAFREVALKRDLKGVAERTELVAQRLPSAGGFGAQVRAAGFDDVQVHQESFKLPFRNAAELFSDRLIASIGLPEWRWIAGLDDASSALLPEIERTLDVYFGGGPLSLSVEAGVVVARR